MRFVQLKAGDVRRVAVVEEPKLRLLRDFDSVYALAQAAIARGGNLTSVEPIILRMSLWTMTRSTPETPAGSCFRPSITHRRLRAAWFRAPG